MIRFSRLMVLLFLLVGFGLLSCDKMAVSQEVNEADELKPIIKLTGILNNKTRVYQSKISVLLKNSDDKAVEIKGGKVKVNGYTMTPPNTALLGPDKHDDYVLNIDVVPDESYVFEIILSNGQVYNAWIESPAVFPTTLEVPQRVERNTHVTVKWHDTDSRYPQYIILQNYDNDKGFSEDDQVELKIVEPNYGLYIIDKKYIKYQNVSDEQVNETRIILKAQTEGTLDTHFSQSGTITCTYEIFAELEIY